MLSRGATLSQGVVDPDPESMAGVPVTGRRLEMMPVLVRWRVTAGVDVSSLSCDVRKRTGKCEEDHLAYGFIVRIVYLHLNARDGSLKDTTGFI